MAPRPRPGILDIAPYVGGEASIAGRNRAIRLASNENPLGASPRAKAAYTALGNPEIRKVIETAGSTVAEPMTLAQLDAFYKQEAVRGAAIAKSIKLQPQ